MISVYSFLMILGIVLIPALVIISVCRLLMGRRKDSKQGDMPLLADPTHYPWNARHGPWYFGNWGINEKVNAAISEGRRRQRYPRGSQRRQATRHKH